MIQGNVVNMYTLVENIVFYSFADRVHEISLMHTWKFPDYFAVRL